ncbi:hypothetical protein V865_005086 [Kwoniella europaea PYCC6329]|uniref:Stc1 domain-containing protein n=1 Tax=Kwoniella europaea PYCC6329 TaxID=1423913 RepID=A0AAX4KM11_9TREE
MQSSQGSSSGSGFNSGPSHPPQSQNGQYYPLPTSIFPITGSRAAGVDLQTNNNPQPPVIAHGLTQSEINRHQRPAHVTGKEAEGEDYRAGFFPIPGNKWSWDTVGNGDQEQPIPAGNSGNQSQAESSSINYDGTIQGEQSKASISSAGGGGGGGNVDPISAFLSEMPTRAEDPTRHVLWTELIKLKTRTLELQIAEARKKEKEAELEIMRLKAGAAAKDSGVGSDNATSSNHGGQNMLAGSSKNSHNNEVDHYSINPQCTPSNTQQQHQQNHSSNPFVPHNQAQIQPQSQPVMSPFDLEAMLSTENLDNFLSWLPDLGDHSLPDISSLAPNTDYSTNNHNNGNMPFSLEHPTNLLPQNTTFPPSVNMSITEPNTLPQPQSSPQRRLSASAEETSPAQLQPPSKRSRRGTEKKIVSEHTSSCMGCKKNIARIMIRSPKSTMPEPIIVQLNCTGCKPINQPSSTNNGIGTVETRKRIRVQMEIDDEETKVKERKQWCDVCQRIIASGQILGGDENESVSSMTEIVCGECDSKYQRCTDCGGGGGSRIGIGKWRMKQVFHPGRKTCSLNHTRLGDRIREMGVHVTPTDFTPEQIKEVLTRCKALWNEKTLARLAVPEMLEVDLPPGLSNPLRDFADVDDIITRNWPSREAMIRADDLDPNKFKRMISLIWSHSKPRRSVRTVDLEEEWSKDVDNDDDLSTVLAHVKRTNVVIPPGSELIGMWGGEWNLQNGSLLISTFIPFEGADGEDSTALSVGEMITKVQSLQQEINAERTQQAKREGKQPDLLPPCEHLWTVSGGYIPLVRERFADILIRKRSFVHVEEYLTRHPEFIESIRARPVGLHPDIHRPLPLTQSASDDEQREKQAEPLILVRWLGKEFDAAKILEIKQMEFGGGAKRKKRKL